MTAINLNGGGVLEFFRREIPRPPERLRDGSLVEQFDLGRLRAKIDGVEVSLGEIEALARRNPDLGETISEVSRTMKREAENLGRAGE